MIIFRVDSSNQIGAGHVMRCLVLAQQLWQRGETVQFVCQMLNGNTIAVIEKQGFIVHQLQNLFNQQQDANETIALITTVLAESVDWLIVDHYGLDDCWEKLLRQYVKKIMVLDDLANRKHDCDVLLDQTLNRDKQDYISLVPTRCQLLLGSHYALLRPEFSQLREQAQHRRLQTQAIKKVFISFGATDPNNVTGLFLQAVMAQVTHLQFDVIIGSQMKYFDEIGSRSYPDFIHIHKNVENMGEYMLEADMAIGAAGTTSWERCCLGLPTLLLVVADNQEKIANELDKSGAAKLMGKMGNVNMYDVVNVLARGVRQPEIFTQMSAPAMRVCDGHGVKRVVAALC